MASASAALAKPDAARRIADQVLAVIQPSMGRKGDPEKRNRPVDEEGR
jgi:hypothetical protein